MTSNHPESGGSDRAVATPAGPARTAILAGAVAALLAYLCGFFVGAGGVAALWIPLTLLVAGGVCGLLSLLPGTGRVLVAGTALAVTGFLISILTVTSASPGAVGWVALAFGLLAAAGLGYAQALLSGVLTAPAPRPKQAPAPEQQWGTPGLPGHPGHGGRPGHGAPGQPGQPGQVPYGQPVYGQPVYGQPVYGQPVYGRPAHGSPHAYGGYPAGGAPAEAAQAQTADPAHGGPSGHPGVPAAQGGALSGIVHGGQPGQPGQPGQYGPAGQYGQPGHGPQGQGAAQQGPADQQRQAGQYGVPDQAGHHGRSASGAGVPSAFAPPTGASYEAQPVSPSAGGQPGAEAPGSGRSASSWVSPGEPDAEPSTGEQPGTPPPTPSRTGAEGAADRSGQSGTGSDETTRAIRTDDDASRS